ncbi:MAG: GNAT family N-acetyltransferase [Albidovulum sp.]|nr:GNAT family N-acetyltransferase [Albidovulum sp.]
MKIRVAERIDAESIADIWNPVIRDTEATFNSVEKSEEDLRALIAGKRDSGLPVLVACDPAIAGFALCGQFRGGIGYARTMEHTIMLAPYARGKGMGRKLMAALEERARLKDIHSLIAGVSSANSSGVEFHRAIGYKEVARLPEVGFKFGNWYDLILLQKFL